MKNSYIVLAAWIIGHANIQADGPQLIKHPNDKCPPGYKTVENETRTRYGGEGEGGVKSKIININISLNGQRETIERSQVCQKINAPSYARDNVTKPQTNKRTENRIPIPKPQPCPAPTPNPSPRSSRR